MESEISLLFAALIGFGHAFEADHLLAVSTLVSRSNSNRQVISNGFIWGLGHTSTIFAIGLLLIVFQVNALKAYFDYFELFVGFMLIVLGVARLLRSKPEGEHGHSHDGQAYGIGLVHGLAGSGSLVLLVLANLESTWEALSYLALFGIGSAVGMSVAATVLRLPLLKGQGWENRKKIFRYLASGLCIVYGLYIFYQFVG